LKRQVAVKVLPPELSLPEEIRLRFVARGRDGGAAVAPAISCRSTPVGESPDGLVYFVMAYVDGESLVRSSSGAAGWPPDESRRIMQETADALGAAHAFGIIHPT